MPSVVVIINNYFRHLRHFKHNSKICSSIICGSNHRFSYSFLVALSLLSLSPQISHSFPIGKNLWRQSRPVTRRHQHYHRPSVITTMENPSSEPNSNSNNNNATTTSQDQAKLRLISPLMPSSDVSFFTKNKATTAMIILNTPIAKPPSVLFDHLWNSSSYHICADGGANRLYDATFTSKVVENNSNHHDYMPEAIRGDLDSLPDHVREYYASKQVLIERDPCQETNDLDKSLQKVMAIRSYETYDDDNKNKNDDTKGKDAVAPTPLPYDQVIIYGGFGGRFDQEMASFQALYKWAKIFQSHIWLYSDETSAVLIPGDDVEVEIVVPFRGTPDNIREGPTCGLIPLGAKCDSMTTTGFQWNLQNAPTEFGGLVSTSNHIIGNDDGKGTVTVRASHPIVFTTEIICPGKSTATTNVVSS